MHKSATLLSLVALGASTVLAQQDQQTGPFALRLSASSSSLDGQYLVACHAGAAIEALCLLGSDEFTTDEGYTSFYLNTSSGSSYGSLLWNLPIEDGDTTEEVPSIMSLAYDLGTNVAVPYFEPSSVATPAGLTSDGELYLWTAFNDAYAVADADASADIIDDPRNLTQWYACYSAIGDSYYDHIIAWVTSGESHNPTCQSVKIFKEDI